MKGKSKRATHDRISKDSDLIFRSGSLKFKVREKEKRKALLCRFVLIETRMDSSLLPMQ